MSNGKSFNPGNGTPYLIDIGPFVIRVSHLPQVGDKISLVSGMYYLGDREAWDQFFVGKVAAIVVKEKPQLSFPFPSGVAHEYECNFCNNTD